MFVSFIKFGNVQYISGFRFRQHSGQDICLYYNISKNEMSLSLDCSVGNQDECNISGFHPAIDSKGLQAISLVTTSGQVSRWLGDHDGIPKARLISGHTNSITLKGGFDVG